MAVVVTATGLHVPAGAQGLGRASEIPRFPIVIESEGRPDHPTWIAADALLDAFGRLQRATIPPAVAEVIRGKEDLIDEINDFGNLAPSKGMPCTVDRAVLGTTWGEPDVPRTLGELLRRAHFAVRGEVSAAVGGFWDGEPATMITIVVTEVFKPAPGVELPHYMNVPIFAGEITLGSARICTSQTNWSTSPKVGDEVFLFPTSRFGPENTLAIDPAGSEIVFSSNGALVFPGALGSYLELDEFEPGVRTDPAEFAATLRAVSGIR